MAAHSYFGLRICSYALTQQHVDLQRKIYSQQATNKYQSQWKISITGRYRRLKTTIVPVVIETLGALTPACETW